MEVLHQNYIKAIECCETEFDKEFDKKDRRSRESLLTGILQVYLRIRPATQEELRNKDQQFNIKIEDNTSLVVVPSNDSNTYKNLRNQGAELNQFRFYYTHIFDENSTQKDIYLRAISRLVEKFIHGTPCLFFTYGITNSGKTYTMQGNISNMGILPRFLVTVFHTLNNKIIEPEMNDTASAYGSSLSKESTDTISRISKINSMESENINESSTVNLWKFVTNDVHICKISREHNFSRYYIAVSFVEIYNDFVYDLLLKPDVEIINSSKGVYNRQTFKSKLRGSANKTIRDNKRVPLEIREDVNGNVYLKKVTEVYVTSIKQVMHLLARGKKNLKMASTMLNYNSSRSHALFTIKLHRSLKTSPQTIISSSEFTFCDLAGSERTQKTGNEGSRLREAININSSLMTLSKCLECLKYNQLHEDHPKIVPFRECKLTRLLQKYFTKRSQISMVVNVAKAAPLFDETLHAMKFSALAKKVILMNKESLQTTFNRHKSIKALQQSKILNPCHPTLMLHPPSTAAAPAPPPPKITSKSLKLLSLLENLEPRVYVNANGITVDLEENNKRIKQEVMADMQLVLEEQRKESIQKQNELRKYHEKMYSELDKQKQMHLRNYFEKEMALAECVYVMREETLQTKCKEYMDFIEDVLSQFIEPEKYEKLKDMFISDVQIDQNMIEELKRSDQPHLLTGAPETPIKIVDLSSAPSPFPLIINGRGCDAFSSTMRDSPSQQTVRANTLNKDKQLIPEARDGTNANYTRIANELPKPREINRALGSTTVKKGKTSRKNESGKSLLRSKPDPGRRISLTRLTRSAFKTRQHQNVKFEDKIVVAPKLQKAQEDVVPVTQTKSSLLRFKHSPRVRPGESYHSQCSASNSPSPMVKMLQTTHKQNTKGVVGELEVKPIVIGRALRPLPTRSKHVGARKTGFRISVSKKNYAKRRH